MTQLHQSNEENKTYPLWIKRSGQLDELIARLSVEPEIAIDTEFHRERSYFPKLALLQLGWSSGCALIDTLAIDISPLMKLFSGASVFIFHAFDQDLNILDRAVGGVPQHLFDTQIAAGFLGHSKPGLSMLLERYLEVTLPKADRLSDWTARPLSSAQVSYAASDVTHLIELKRKMNSALLELERQEWNRQETEILSQRRHILHDPDEVWTRIKECRNLSRDSRKVAKYVAKWREENAIDLDIPPRYLISDLAVATIAQSKPRSLSELHNVRGLDTRRISNEAERALLAAISQGMSSKDVPELPASDFLIPKGSAALVSLCATWITAKSQQQHLDPSLVASRDEISEYLFVDRGRLKHGWRSEIFGVDITAIREGRAAVGTMPDGSLRLIALTD